MSARIVAVHKKPKDPAAYDKYYQEVHVPLALKLPGLLKYEVTAGPVVYADGESDIHLIATLHFADLAAVHKALDSEQGRAAAADLPNFSEPGAIRLLYFETTEVPATQRS